MPDRNYEKHFDAYMKDVQDYLAKVQRGRRVPKADPQDPRFSQTADTQRQINRAGLREHQPQVPPMYEAPRGTDPHSYGFTNTYQPHPAAKFFGDRLEELQDPRVGMVPGVGGVMKFKNLPGWGEEVLRRYKLLGGTSETLNKALLKRHAYEPERADVRRMFREGTDLAAPPRLSHQEDSMRGAGRIYEDIRPSHPEAGSRTAGEISALRERMADAKLRAGRPPAQVEASFPSIPSGAQGNAAYNAISSRMGRIMDEPGFQFKKSRYTDPAPVSAQEYYKEFPIQPSPKDWQGIANFLRDERGSFNPGSWFGLGRKSAPTPDPGGFNVPTSQMSEQSLMTGFRNQPEAIKRQLYLDDVIGQNRYIENFRANDPRAVQDLMRLEAVNPDLANSISKTAMGKMALSNLRTQAFDPAMETNPPLQVRRMFGFTGE